MSNLHEVDAKVANALFVNQITHNIGNTPVLQKISEAVNQEISDVIRNREDGKDFADLVIPPKTVSESDFHIDGDSDIPIKFEYTDIPNPRSMTVNFSGGVDARIHRARRFNIPLYEIRLERMTFELKKLRFHPVSVTNLILNKVNASVKDTIDRQFLVHIERGLQLLNAEVNSSDPTIAASSLAAGTVTSETVIMKSDRARDLIDGSGNPLDNFDVQNLTRNDIVRIKRASLGRDGTRLSNDRLLISEWDVQGFSDLSFDDLGGRMAEDTFRNGVSMTQWHGLRLIMTNKTEILRPGNVYAFAPADYFGRHYELDPLRLWLQVNGMDTIEIGGGCSRAMGFANLHGCKKLELYSASAVTGYETYTPDPGSASTVADELVRPYSELLIHARDNLSGVEQGLVQPLVSRVV